MIHKMLEILGRLVVIVFIVSFIAAIFLVPFWLGGDIGRTPKTGDYYIEKYQHDNPFIYHETNTIVAVRNGYVSYKKYDSKEYNQTLCSFRLTYIHVGHTPPLIEDQAK